MIEERTFPPFPLHLQHPIELFTIERPAGLEALQAQTRPSLTSLLARDGPGHLVFVDATEFRYWKAIAGLASATELDHLCREDLACFLELLAEDVVGIQ